MVRQPVLTAAKLRRILRKGEALPKFGNHGTGGAMLHPYQPRDQKSERAILSAMLSKLATPEEQAQAVLIANCRPRSPCRNWLCPLCKNAHLKTEISAAKLGMSRCRKFEDYSFLTIIGGVTEEGINAAVQLARDLIDRTVTVLQKWPGVRAYGRVEVDFLYPKDPPQVWKPKTLAALGLAPERDAPALVVHLHVNRRGKFVHVLNNPLEVSILSPLFNALVKTLHHISGV